MTGRQSRYLDSKLLGPRLDAVFAACATAGLLRGGGAIAAATLEGEPITATYGATAGGEPTRPDHRFLLTSITKPFTAIQVLQLAEAGLLDLRAPVAATIPEFGRHGKEHVTTWHLLTHTSGIDLVANTAEGPSAGLTPQQHLQAALDAGLNFEPGTRFEYCSPGFWVLAELVTRLTGRHYTDELVTMITGPLGMTGTRYELQESAPERWAGANALYEAHLAEQVRRAGYPAGGIVGTVGDLVTFGRALLGCRGGAGGGGGAGDPNRGAGPQLVSPATLDAMACRAIAGWYQGRTVAWGLGWELGGLGDFGSDRTLFHYGGSGTGFWVDLDRGVVIALLTTSWHLDWQVYGRLANAVYGALA